MMNNDKRRAFQDGASKINGLEHLSSYIVRYGMNDMTSYDIFGVAAPLLELQTAPEVPRKNRLKDWRIGALSARQCSASQHREDVERVVEWRDRGRVCENHIHGRVSRHDIPMLPLLPQCFPMIPPCIYIYHMELFVIHLFQCSTELLPTPQRGLGGHWLKGDLRHNIRSWNRNW